MYLELIKAKTRFQTSKGSLSMEQLFDLSLTDLDQLAVTLSDQYEASKKSKSFLTKRTKKDKGIKMQLDFVLSVMEYKQEQDNASKAIAEKREWNSKIGNLIQQKEDQELSEMSIDQLKKLMK